VVKLASRGFSTAVGAGLFGAGMYPVKQKCLHHMLNFLSRILQLDEREYAEIAMLECIVRMRLQG
jgi:hypothetical protein